MTQRENFYQFSPKEGFILTHFLTKEFSSFLNIHVADIQAVYKEWRGKGAEFITEPKHHQYEIRCFMRDPDGYIIEVGQSTSIPDSL